MVAVERHPFPSLTTASVREDSGSGSSQAASSSPVLLEPVAVLEEDGLLLVAVLVMVVLILEIQMVHGLVQEMGQVMQVLTLL